MIKYNLNCENSHEFESWFSDSKEFEKLRRKNLLECIFCKSKKIKKSIMSPSLARTKKSFQLNRKDKNQLLKFKRDLKKLRNYVEKNFEYVGSNFASKAREIYYDKKRNKNIYGSTTKKEREQLIEEGIELMSIPWVDKEN